MTVLRYLDLSTAHLTQPEMEGLSHATQGHWPRVIAHEYGAWVHVLNFDEPTDLETHAELAKTRPNLAACLDKAREHDCTWINFDCDAEADDTLPTYDW